MKQKLSCLTLSIALLASSNWCNAANRYVSAGSDGDGLSWATAKGSIKSAVESCHTGDTVFVSSGLYNEYVSIVDGVNILGGYNADTGARDIETFETILDGTGLGKYLIVKYDSPCENPTLIEGLTLQNADIAAMEEQLISGRILLFRNAVSKTVKDKTEEEFSMMEEL